MSRRLLRGVAVTAALVAGLTACSGDGSDDGGPDEPTDGGTSGDVRRVPGVPFQPDAAALSPDGKRIVVPCLDDLCVWETGDGSLAETWAGGSLVAWSPTGDVVATDGVSADGAAGVTLLDPETGDEVRTLAGHQLEDATDGGDGGVTDLEFSPDGERLATSGTDGTVRIWSLEAGDEVATLETEGDRPDSLAFDPSGERLAVAAPDQPVEVWDLAAGEREGTLDAESQGEVAWSPEGDVIASDTRAATDAATVTLWDAATLEATEVRPEPLQADQLAFSPDGRTLAISQKDEENVVLWPVGGGEQRLLAGGEETVRAVLWSADGSRVFAVGARDGVLAWAATGAPASGPEVFEEPS